MYFIVDLDLFHFQINTNITIESTFYRYARRYQSHCIEYFASILHIQQI